MRKGGRGGDLFAADPAAAGYAVGIVEDGAWPGVTARWGVWRRMWARPESRGVTVAWAPGWP